jgi:hypothetical protein
LPIILIGKCFGAGFGLHVMTDAAETFPRAADYRTSLARDDPAPAGVFHFYFREVIHTCVMSRSKLLTVGIFSRWKRSEFHSPWLTPHARKRWKSSEMKPSLNLSVVVLTTRQNASTNQEITEATSQQSKFEADRNSLAFR